MSENTPLSTNAIRANAKCPICGKPRKAEHAPFCSKACRDRDLLQWLGDGYALPGPSAPQIPDPDIYPQDD